MDGLRIASGGISTFGNLILKDFGYDSFTTILFTMPTGIVQIVSIIGSAWVSTRIGRKGIVITGVSIFPTIGTVLMLTVPRNDGNRGVLLLGYYLVMCMAAITPMIYAWSAQNTGGDTKKKTSSAVMFVSDT